MDSRVRVFKKLLRLSGRLDMLLSHADLLQGRSEAHHQPKNIYIEDEGLYFYLLCREENPMKQR